MGKRAHPYRKYLITLGIVGSALVGVSLIGDRIVKAAQFLTLTDRVDAAELKLNEHTQSIQKLEVIAEMVVKQQSLLERIAENTRARPAPRNYPSRPSSGPERTCFDDDWNEKPCP